MPALQNRIPEMWVRRPRCPFPMSLTPVTARVAQVSAAIALVNMPLCHVIHSSVYLPPFGPHIQAFDNATSAHPFIVGIACLEVLCLFGAVL